MTTGKTATPQEIVSFWFPDGPEPEPDNHMKLWTWRMRGGADLEICEKYTGETQLAATGGFDHWAETPAGRLALIIVLDQFPRSVWAGSPEAYAQDPKALAICLEGLENGHFDALPNVWYKSVFKLPLEHCECPAHLANLDRAIAIADRLLAEAPPALEGIYAFAAQQPRKHRSVIERFGRHCHRNAILGRVSTPEEEAYIAAGAFPHQTEVKALLD